ncbi:MAG: DnaJ domain-containing protein [Calditrichaeota bacterium]|nr:DnaJ domain-containing protein [Calditrichota bacterium]
MKNYYAILGVSRDATLDEIKKAYRELVRKYHPDVGETSDVERFLEVQEAFEVLSSREKRQVYDEKIRQQERRRMSHLEGTLERLFSDLEMFLREFEALRREREYAERRVSKYYLPEDLAVEIILTPEEAKSGGNLTLDVPIYTECPSCEGSGVSFPFRCFHCGGSGRVEQKKAISIKVPELYGGRQKFKLDLSQFGIEGELTIFFKITYY